MFVCDRFVFDTGTTKRMFFDKRKLYANNGIEESKISKELQMCSNVLLYRNKHFFSRYSLFEVCLPEVCYFQVLLPTIFLL